MSTLAGGYKILAQELYEMFGTDTFTAKDYEAKRGGVHPYKFKSLALSGFLELVEKGNNKKRSVYRVPEATIKKLTGGARRRG